MSPKIFYIGDPNSFSWAGAMQNFLTFRGTTLLTFRVRDRKRSGGVGRTYTERDCSLLKRWRWGRLLLISGLVVILQPQMSDEIFASKVTQSILELH
jgi:hypothetical protein